MSPAEPRAAEKETRGLAVASFALGAFGLLTSPLVIGAVFALAALALGVADLARRPARRSLVVWGMLLGLSGLCASLLAGALYHLLHRELAGRADRGTDAESAWVGQTLPELSFVALDGGELDLASARGRPLLLNFWATWCGPCKRELPHLNRLARERPELLIVGLSDEAEDTLRAFVLERPIDFPIASLPYPPAPFDEVSALPTNVFVDRQGVIREVRTGGLSFETLSRLVDAADAAGSPTPN